MRVLIWVQKWIVDKLTDLTLNDQRQRRQTPVALGARCCGEGAAHRNKNADVAVRCTFNPTLCIKTTDVLAALLLGVGLIWVALIFKLQGLLLFELSQILR